jgi:hypothetical protein
MSYALLVNYATRTAKWIHEQEIRLTSTTNLQKSSYIDHIGINDIHLPLQSPMSSNLVNLSGIEINNESSHIEHIG